MHVLPGGDGGHPRKHVVGALRRAVAVGERAAVGVDSLVQPHVGGHAPGRPVVVDVLHGGGGFRIDFAIMGVPLLDKVPPGVVPVADLVERDGRLVEGIVAQAGDRAHTADVVRAVTVKRLITNQALTPKVFHFLAFHSLISGDSSHSSNTR